MRRSLALVRALAVVGLTASAAGSAAAGGGDSLRFLRDGKLVRELSKRELSEQCHPTRTTVELDPYYGRRMEYLACPFARIFELGFGSPPGAQGSANVFLLARDGYAKPASAALLAEPGGYLAFADARRAHGADAGFEPIERRQLDPGPFYLVWTGTAQVDANGYPWPYQLAAIDVASFESRYPHTAPVGEPEGSPPWQGFALFQRNCAACHAINGEGGSVGPELNVPLSIVEYRPADQLKAFIRDPQRFRYTSMPPHPGLTDADLDALLAYLRAMSQRKQDPRAAPGR